MSLSLTDHLNSIVAVHGFNGDRKRSWTHRHFDSDGRESTCFWLSDFLPFDVPQASIYTYGYPAGTSIDAAAQDLIRALDNERLRCNSFETPIAFMAHNTGGLIVKQVCL